MQFSDIKGLGKTRIAKLNEAGIYTPADLLTLFPYKYVFDDCLVSDFEDGKEARVVAKLVGLPKVVRLPAKRSIVSAKMLCGESELEAIWFNRPFVASQLKDGEYYAVIGRLKRGKTPKLYVSVHADYEGEFATTIYRPVSDVPSKLIKEAVRKALPVTKVEGNIPDEYCRECGIPTMSECITAMHIPQNRDQLALAARSVALQLLAASMRLYAGQKAQASKNKKNKYDAAPDVVTEAMDMLPFDLTDGQKSAVDDIIFDLKSDKRMNRLLQGDVGCGKTVVAFLAMYYAAVCGFQSAFMAPTEILAEQHYKKAVDFFGKKGIKCVNLCGSQTKKEREFALAMLISGEAKIAIGTHALISDEVRFQSLSLVVTDEQQRFGVKQRGALESKDDVDVLVMTATPIPRTLALTLYGALDISTIKQCAKHAEILTRVVSLKKESDMFDYLYANGLKGEKSYLVCSRIDEDEDLVSANSLYFRLKRKYGNCVGIVHGQMKEQKKSQEMARFVGGNCTMLVCTTVIEVGIDVPSATSVAIYNPERYGLSQLHQLRGRVGRGSLDSYCFVVSDEINERLSRFVSCDNGFELAEYDFSQRGAGDFLGTRQHGSEELFGGVKIDAELLKDAKGMADILIRDNVEIEGGKYIKNLTLN